MGRVRDAWNTLWEEGSAAVQLQAVPEPERPDLRQLGASGQTMYATLNLREYLPELMGMESVRVYDKMRRSDAQVRATLRLVKTPIIAAQWYIQPASDSDEDARVAEFVDWNLQTQLGRPLIRFLWEALLMLDFGFYVFEKNWEVQTWTPEAKGARERSVVTLSLAPRHPLSIQQFDYDSAGHVKDLVHRRVDGVTGAMTLPTIPASKLMIFTLDEEAEDPTGMSILRSAYKHWYYKENLYKVDAIQKERHGIGIPKIKLPIGYTDEDKRFANEMGQNLRTNEKAFITLPPGWDVEMLQINTQLVNALASAEHHDLMIARNVLGQFINLGSTTSGSRALGGSQMEIFVKSLSYVADIVRGEFNTSAIPELVRFNFPDVAHYPKLMVRRIGETQDLRALSAGVRNLIESNVITPDPGLEKWMRETLDFPEPPKDVMDRSVQQRTQKATAKQSPIPTSGDSVEQKARQGNKSAAPTLTPPGKE